MPAQSADLRMSIDEQQVASRVTEIRPVRGLLDLDLGSVWRYRELLYFLVWRDVKIRYKQAALGVAWAVIQPVIAVLIFTAIFSVFARIPTGDVPYPLFAFAAVLPWTYFAEAMRRASTGLVNDADLVRKIYFPRLIIPLSAAIGPLVEFFIGLLILAGMMSWFGVELTWKLIFLGPLILVALGLALAVGLILGPLNVRFRDVMHTLPFLTQVWMYASPVVYPVSIVPDRWIWLYSLNPMVGVIEAFRWAVVGHASPNIEAIAVSSGVIVLGLIVGLIYFRSSEKTFADLI